MRVLKSTVFVVAFVSSRLSPRHHHRVRHDVNRALAYRFVPKSDLDLVFIIHLSFKFAMIRKPDFVRIVVFKCHLISKERERERDVDREDVYMLTFSHDSTHNK